MSEAALARPPAASAATLRRLRRDDARERPVDWRYHLARAAGSLAIPRRLLLTERRIERFVHAVARHRADRHARTVADLGDELRAARGVIARDRHLDGHGARVVALGAELSRRTLGLDPFASQIRGAAVLLDGAVAEMATGSGKTLTVALAAIAAVHAGSKVHVITANDYLADRDVRALAPLFAAAGLTVGLVARDVPAAARQRAYDADVVYASNKEIAFDYLRTRLAVGADAGPIRLALAALHQPGSRVSGAVMRGLPFAIVDEADSVLVDECRTPLIISGDTEPRREDAEVALRLGDALRDGHDYVVDPARRTISFTEIGRRRLAALGDEIGGVWRNAPRRDEAARLGISARRFHRRDEQYLVRDGRIQLIDEYTGRVAAQRALGDGLQQVLEAKEGLEPSGRRYTHGRITYQRFFRRYGRLAGVTATAREVGGELAAVYGLAVVPVAAEHTTRRRRWRTRICDTEAEKWDLVARRVRSIAGAGRPVLVATRTVRASEAASAALAALGVPHRVLSAAQDAAEAAVIAEAGARGRVTVATNMAGRGVDIRLGPGVADLGGLHVVLTEFHEARRIDRQVVGRAGRQGDPGSWEAVLSRQDPLVRAFAPRWGGRVPGGGAFRLAQRRAERMQARARLDLLRHDVRREQKLGFTGSFE